MWCQTVENQLRLQGEEWPTADLHQKLRLAARALKGIFPQVLPIESDVVRSFMASLRSGLIDFGLKHLEWMKATVLWAQNCSPERIHERAKKVYDEWERTSKTSVLTKIRANLLHKFSSQFIVSEEETMEKAGLLEVVSESDVDTTVAPDSVGLSEDSVCLEQPPNVTPGECGLQLARKDDIQPENAENELNTPDKWIVPAYSDDEEPFRRRLSTIYVNLDGVGCQPKGLWPNEASDTLISQVVRDMHATFAEQNA
ncbi:hypothetical protein R1sor_023042 [Riccia sorocarpa]|uniref:Uncharacterized protein n=1 Tax=Riccia sorocarpa TaxID=122646 RepID=A0ABD3GNB9_9MARC